MLPRSKESSFIQLYFLSGELPYVSFLPGKLPFAGESPLKNKYTLLACLVYKQQVHRVLILSISNKYEKLFQVK